MIDDRVVVGITQGDVNGIGTEVMLRAFEDEALFELCVPVLYGSSRTVEFYKRVLKLNMKPWFPVSSAAHAQPGCLNVCECFNGEKVRVHMGEPTREAGTLALRCLEGCLRDVAHIDAILTLPINKNTMQSESFSFPGHTEYLTKNLGCQDSLMLMVSDSLRVGVVTAHLPLHKVSEQITKELILRKIEILTNTLYAQFGVDIPRIAVLGLNPHAGEGGMLGYEELETIAPAVEMAQSDTRIVTGPHPADGFFGAEMWRHYDAVLAMYHDQGLIPFKALAFEGGVNFTAGLPLVRTSPAHGTAYSLVGQGEATINPFRAALYVAVDGALRNRNMFELKKEMLGTQAFEQIPIKSDFIKSAVEEFALTRASKHGDLAGRSAKSRRSAPDKQAVEQIQEQVNAEPLPSPDRQRKSSQSISSRSGADPQQQDRENSSLDPVDTLTEETTQSLPTSLDSPFEEELISSGQEESPLSVQERIEKPQRPIRKGRPARPSGRRERPRPSQARVQSRQGTVKTPTPRTAQREPSSPKPNQA